MRLTIREIFNYLTICSLLVTTGVIASSGGSALSIDLKERAQSAKAHNKVMILYIGASYCTYCKKLNRDVINPMLSNKGYNQKVALTHIELDGTKLIIDFSGKAIDSDELVEKYNIDVTPTLLFMDNKGNEIAKRIVGYQNKDFYWFYLDQSIDVAFSTL